MLTLDERGIVLTMPVHQRYNHHYQQQQQREQLDQALFGNRK